MNTNYTGNPIPDSHRNLPKTEAAGGEDAFHPL